VTENVVRYDSPVFAGFSMSASWGEDDMWDVAARYAGEWNGIKLAAAAAYSQQNDECLAVCLGGVADNLVQGRRDVGYFQIGAYVEHVATGLWVYGAYGRENVDSIYVMPNGNLFTEPNNPSNWYVKAGLRERWTHLGHTVVYGEYGNHDDQLNPTLQFTGAGATGSATDSEFRQWGVGVVQEIDAAAMSMWISYRHFDGSMDCNPNPAATATACGSGAVQNARHLDLQDWQMVKFGALINF
jgi:hypothetical protein